MEIEALAWRLLERIGALHRQGKLSKEATLALNDPATELRRALAHAAINKALLEVRVDVREETAEEEWARHIMEPPAG